MARQLTLFSAGSYVLAATLNAMQLEAQGLLPATDLPATLFKGTDARWWTTPDAGVPDQQLRVLDTSLDWRNHRLWGFFRNLGAADRRPGQANDHLPNDPTSAVSTRVFHGWSGSGGLGAAAATVANGTPPVLADNAFAVIVDELATSADRVLLYVRPSDGALCLYNDSGATLHAELLVWGAGAAPTPGAPPPDVIPTLTEVLWLTPSAAADRPASADGPALHRATDTGAISLWDGAAWRVLVSSTVNATQLQGRAVASDAPTDGQALVWDAGQSRWEPGTVGGGSVAATDLTDGGAVGVTVVQADTVAEALAALGAYQAVPDTGWTDTGTVTHVAGVHTCSVAPSGDSAALRVTPVDPLAQGLELVARLDYTTGVPATDAWAYLGVTNAGRTHEYSVQVTYQGAVQMWWANGGGRAFLTATGSGAVDLTANTAWIRLVITGSIVAVYYATDASRPLRTGWTRVGSATTNADLLANGTLDRVLLGAGRDAAGSGTYTTAWSDVAYRALLGLVA